MKKIYLQSVQDYFYPMKQECQGRGGGGVSGEHASFPQLKRKFSQYNFLPFVSSETKQKNAEDVGNRVLQSANS